MSLLGKLFYTKSAKAAIVYNAIGMCLGIASIIANVVLCINYYHQQKEFRILACRTMDMQKLAIGEKLPDATYRDKDKVVNIFNWRHEGYCYSDTVKSPFIQIDTISKHWRGDTLFLSIVYNKRDTLKTFRIRKP
jgi:hypothetical protein